MKFDIHQHLAGCLANVPPVIACAMAREQVLQKDKLQMEEFKAVRTGGFIWDNTINRHKFWQKVIRNQDFDLFFQLYAYFI